MIHRNITTVQDGSFGQDSCFHATIDYQDSYVQPIIVSAFQRRFRSTAYRLHNPSFTYPPIGEPWLQICTYENLDFNALLARPSNTLANSYVIRKALIRKHYLAHTVSDWLSKHPGSILKDHVKPTVDFEVDYAEFLDDALLEAYELKESLNTNRSKMSEFREWWILKPGMSDRGQGIRLFSTMKDLQFIFDEWDPNDTDDEQEKEDETEDRSIPATSTNIMTSQLRHFVAQPYISSPLLLPEFKDHKFHIRVYVLALGALQVYVYDHMLALCASKPYTPPGSGSNIDLESHLTNTCLQTSAKGLDSSPAVHVIEPDFLKDCSSSKPIFEQILAVTTEIFEAAARGQMVHFQTLPNAFEVFGLDFLVDAEQKAWLLEINAFPDFAQSGQEEGREVIEGLWDEVIRIAVGDWVDGILCGDRMKKGDALAKTTKKNKQVKEGNIYKGRLRRVLDIDLGRR